MLLLKVIFGFGFRFDARYLYAWKMFMTLLVKKSDDCLRVQGKSSLILRMCPEPSIESIINHPLVFPLAHSKAVSLDNLP